MMKAHTDEGASPGVGKRLSPTRTSRPHPPHCPEEQISSSNKVAHEKCPLRPTLKSIVPNHDASRRRSRTPPMTRVGTICSDRTGPDSATSKHECTSEAPPPRRRAPTEVIDLDEAEIVHDVDAAGEEKVGVQVSLALSQAVAGQERMASPAVRQCTWRGQKSWRRVGKKLKARVRLSPYIM